MRSNWQIKKIGDIAFHDKESLEPVQIDKVYSMIGVYSYGKGLFIKEDLLGMNTSYKSFYKLKANHIVLSQLFGWEGAISLCSKKFEGKYVSSQFPTFLVKENLANTLFVSYFLQQKKIWNKLFEVGVGMGSRRRTLNPSNLLNLEIPLPPLAEQERIVSKFEAIKARIDEIINLRKEQTKDINNLLFSKYTDLIKGSRFVTMKEAAPICRRPIEINPEKTYSRIGVRSFGRGLFENPSFKGSELTWQTIFRMNEGDILFSNTNGWEGAVGLIPKKYDGWVGSHRYLTCRPNLDMVVPEFLYYYFRTFEGVQKLSAASPGTVARTRTLNTKLLMQIEIPMPSMNLQNEFVNLINQTDAIINYYIQAEQELTDLLPSLLDQVFTGNLLANYDYSTRKEQHILERENDLALLHIEDTESGDLELAMIVALIESRLGVSYGEVGIQKTVYNVEAFYPALNNKYDFVNYHYGTYSVKLRDTLKNNPFLVKKRVKGSEVFTISLSYKKQVLDAITAKDNKNFVDSINRLLDIYTTPFINKETDKIELLNTVAKLIHDLQTSDLEKIYRGLKDWKIKQGTYGTKADKFNLIDVKKAIELINSNDLMGRLCN
ncbi:restriction endonuclease subunit S [Mucilaginibacter sp. HD30]